MSLLKLLKNPIKNSLQNRYGNLLQHALRLEQKNPNSKRAKALTKAYFRNIIKDSVATGVTTGFGYGGISKLIELLK